MSDDSLTLLITCIGALASAGITFQGQAWFQRKGWRGAAWLWLAFFLLMAGASFVAIEAGANVSLFLGIGIFASIYGALVTVVVLVWVPLEHWFRDLDAYKQRHRANYDGVQPPYIRPLMPWYVRLAAYWWRGIRGWHEFLMQGLP